MAAAADNSPLSAGTRPMDGWRQSQGRKRRRRNSPVETSEFAAFTLRVIRAHSRRVGDGNIDSLVDLLAMSHELDQAIASAVTALHEFGYSWTEIADRLGTSRQNARQRWAEPATTMPTQHDLRVRSTCDTERPIMATRGRQRAVAASHGGGGVRA